MTEREKVVGHLQILWTWCAVNPDFGMGLSAEDCVKAVEWLDDALALLKAQEARLVTYEDFHSGREDGGEAIPCWKEARSKTRRSGWSVIVYGKMLADRDTGVARYWTARPTEEQMREEAWPGA